MRENSTDLVDAVGTNVCAATAQAISPKNSEKIIRTQKVITTEV